MVTVDDSSKIFSSSMGWPSLGEAPLPSLAMESSLRGPSFSTGSSMTGAPLGRCSSWPGVGCAAVSAPSGCAPLGRSASSAPWQAGKRARPEKAIRIKEAPQESRAHRFLHLSSRLRQSPSPRDRQRGKGRLLRPRWGARTSWQGEGSQKSQPRLFGWALWFLSRCECTGRSIISFARELPCVHR